MQSGRLRSFPKLAHPRWFCTPRCCRSVCECFGFDAPVAGPGCGTPSRGAETHRGPSLLDQRFASRRRRGDSPLACWWRNGVMRPCRRLWRRCSKIVTQTPSASNSSLKRRKKLATTSETVRQQSCGQKTEGGQFARICSGSGRARCAVKPPRTLRLRSPIAAAATASNCANVSRDFAARRVSARTGPQGTNTSARACTCARETSKICCTKSTTATL